MPVSAHPPSAPSGVGSSPSPGAASPRALPGAGSVHSRAELLTHAPSLSPWALVTLGEEILAREPGDDDVRLLLVRAFIALALATPAREQIDRFSPSCRHDPRVREVTRLASALPDDRIDLGTLQATLKRNVDALASRANGPINLRLHASAWLKRASSFEWFRAINGNIVRRQRSAERAILPVWLGLADARADAQLAARSLAQARPGLTIVPGPITIEGVDPPWVLAAMAAARTIAHDGYSPSITVIQSDIFELLDGLAQTDLSDALGQPWLRLFVGPSAGEQFREHLLTPERLDASLVPTVDHRAPGIADEQIESALLPRAFGLTTLRARAFPRPIDSINAAAREQDRRSAELRQANGQRYAALTLGDHTRRFAEISGTSVSGAPLRVLILTCRFSTYVKHAATDLARALKALGHDARLVIEPDDHTRLTQLATLRAVHEFSPDLLVMINYTRSQVPGSLPTGLPVLTWVQDAMPHLYNREVGSSLGRLDFVAGNLVESLFSSFNYPRSRALVAGMVASPGKFHPGPASNELVERHTCEIAYVSHHSQTPEELHESRKRELGEHPVVARALEALFPAIQGEVRDMLSEPLSLRLKLLTQTALKNASLPAEGSDLERVYNSYTLPIADRTLRHQTLAWVADLARARNWRFHLYGKGWHTHPTLAPFAKGKLAHDDELRASYQCAKVHLQLTVHTIVHQRIIECALSGGTLVARTHADELSTLAFLAAANTCRDGAEPIACHATRRSLSGDPMLAYRADTSPHGQRLNQLNRALGLPEHELLWLGQPHIERVRSEGTGIPPERDLFWLMGDPAQLCFASRPAMERLLVDLVESPERRASARAHLAQRARSHLTFDAFAQRLLKFIAASLAKPDDDGGRRPTDGAGVHLTPWNQA